MSKMDSYRYDLHVHSALSPCAENDMTPVTVVGKAMLDGLDFIAIADHNAIGSVEVALLAGREYGIKVVPAMELQTNEDIHILCLFEKFEELKAFYDEIDFGPLKNNKAIFGDQLMYDEDDNVVAEEERMLLASANISSESVPELVKRHNGVAIPAHIDREMNGMLQILGTVTEGFDTVEISSRADENFVKEWSGKKRTVIDSDAHVLDDISTKGVIELEEYSVAALLDSLGRIKK